VRVLAGHDIHHAIVELVDSATNTLILVTPYMDPWSKLQTAIRTAVVVRNVKTLLVVRGGEDRAKQERQVEKLGLGGRLAVRYVEYLHAKVYLNDRHLLVTSMNLLESSAMNGWEIAIEYDWVADRPAFEEVLRHLNPILKQAKVEEEIRVKLAATAKPVMPALQSAPKAVTTAAPRARSAAPAKATGVCIRCGDGIAANPAKPLCPACYKKWSVYSNPAYEEHYCHTCGARSATSVARPVCRSCFKAS
jgi:hypothetical protein